jgi:hypothetical protein
LKLYVLAERGPTVRGRKETTATRWLRDWSAETLPDSGDQIRKEEYVRNRLRAA